MASLTGRVFSNSKVLGYKHVSTARNGTRRYRYTLLCTCGHTYTLMHKSLGKAKEPCPKCRHGII